MKMKTKIREFLTDVWAETAYGLRMLCGKPTPLKRLVMVFAYRRGIDCGKHLLCCKLHI
jgi:hypothetical protein